MNNIPTPKQSLDDSIHREKTRIRNIIISYIDSRKPFSEIVRLPLNNEEEYYFVAKHMTEELKESGWQLVRFNSGPIQYGLRPL